MPAARFFASFAVAIAAPTAVLNPPDHLKANGIAAAVDVGHPSISLLAGLEGEAGLHASSISLLAGLKKEAGLRKNQLAKHREGLVKLVQTSKKSSTPHNPTTIAMQQNPALSPPPATPPDSAALSADYKALYDQSEARRLAQIKLCDDCKLAEDALVLAFEDAKIKHAAAEDKAVLLVTATTEYSDAKSDYNAKVVAFGNKKTGVVSTVSALTHDSDASAFAALGQMATELGTLASEETSLEGIMNTKLNAKNAAQSVYATAAATAKAADSASGAKTTERGTACAGLNVGPSAPPYMPPPAGPPSTPPLTPPGAPVINQLTPDTARFSLAMADSGVNAPSNGINTVKIHAGVSSSFAIVTGEGNPSFSKIDITDCTSSIGTCGTVLFTAEGGETNCADVDSSGSYALVSEHGRLRYMPLDQPTGSELKIGDMKEISNLGNTAYFGIKISPDDSYAVTATYGGRIYKYDLKTSSYDVTSSSGTAPQTVVLGNGVNSDLQPSEAVDGCGTTVKLGGSYYARAVEFLDQNTFIVAGWYGGRILKVDASSFCTTTIVPLSGSAGVAAFTIHPSKKFLLTGFDQKTQQVDLTDPSYPVSDVTTGSASGVQLVDGTVSSLLGSQFSTAGRNGHMGGICYHPDGSFALMAFPPKALLKITPA